MKSKKGIGIGQVFIFIVAAITFALVMIFGYLAVSDFLTQSEDIEFIQFKSALEKDIKQIYTEYGALRIKEYRVLGQFEQVCFVNMDASYNEELCNYDPIACRVWEDAATAKQSGKTGYESVEENVFLTPPGPVKIKVFKIETTSAQGEGFLCIPLQTGRFSLVLEGRGDRTRVSLPVN